MLWGPPTIVAILAERFLPISVYVIKNIRLYLPPWYISHSLRLCTVSLTKKHTDISSFRSL